MRRSLARRASLLGVALLLAFVAVAVAGLARPEPAAAHPLGNFTINRYSRIELSAEEIRLRYVLDLAEIPAFQARQEIDEDGDGELSPAEQATYRDTLVEQLRANLRFVIDDQPVELRAEASEISFPPGQGGLNTQRLVIDFSAGLPDGWQDSSPQAEYRDGNYRERLGWREVVVLGGEGVRLVESTALAEDASDELRAYPDAGLSNPLNVSSAIFTFEADPGGAASGGVTAPEHAEREERATSGNPDSSLARYAGLIAEDELSAGVIILALLAAVGFGALHALSPGHGKTVVAAYLVGSRGTALHALLLGLTVTATHTSSVYALGFITLYLSEYIVPEELYPWLGVVSGGLILAMGATLFTGRLRSSGLLGDAAAWLRARLGVASRLEPQLALASAPEAESAAQTPGDGETAHHHDHLDEAQPPHRHGLGPAHRHALPGADGSAVSWRSLIGLGIFGGLLPCPSAIVVMLSAVALHRVAFGLILIVAFSVGLAGVLTAIGFALVYAARLSQRLPFLRSLAGRARGAGGAASLTVRAFPVGSAAVVAAAGLVVRLRALFQQGVL